MKRVTIFGKPACGFCQRAKQLCDIKGFDYRFIDILEEGISKADLEITVGKPVETVPQIFIGQDYIGGFTEFDQHVQSAQAV